MKDLWFPSLFTTWTARPRQVTAKAEVRKKTQPERGAGERPGGAGERPGGAGGSCRGVSHG